MYWVFLCLFFGIRISVDFLICIILSEHDEASVLLAGHIKVVWEDGFNLVQLYQEAKHYVAERKHNKHNNMFEGEANLVQAEVDAKQDDRQVGGVLYSLLSPTVVHLIHPGLYRRSFRRVFSLHAKLLVVD